MTLTGGNKESRALRELKDGMYRYVDNLQKLWDVAAEEMVNGEQVEQGAETVKVEDVQFSLRDSDGNEVTLTSEKVEENKEYVANMQPVVKLTGNRFAKQQGKDFKAMALEYFGEKGTVAHSKVLGDVVIDKSGIEHLIASLTWRRSAMLPAIIPVIENGRIIYVEKNHKGYGFDTAVIAGMVNLDGKSYYMGVGIRERNDGSNGYYIHDAVTVEKRNFLPNKSGLVTAGEKAPTLAIILSDLANYNREFAKTERQYALRDTEYLSAVDAGDLDTAQRMVDEAAEQAFSKSKIRGADGKLLKVYHGTNAEFTVFDTSKQGGVNGTVEGYGIYLSDNQDVTKNYGERQIRAYANITNPATSWKKTITQAKLAKLIKASCTQEAQRMVDDGEYDNLRDAMRDTWVSNYTDTYSVSMETAIRDTARSILDMNDDDMNIIREIMVGMAIRSYRDAERFYREILTPATGIDGFWTTWENREGGADSNIILAMNSNQIKDASPVTYDDAGEVIPLSERFNADKQDIRYARRAQNQLTQKQYEAFGWVRENNVLSKQAYSSLMSKYSSIISKTAYARRTPDGYYIVDTGDEFGINKYLVLMKGSIAAPVIEDIYCINLDNETMIDVVRRKLYGELSRTGILSHRTRESFDQDGMVNLFTRGGSKSYSAYTREYATGRTGSGREGTVGEDQYGDLRGGHAGEPGVRYARRDDMTTADVRDIISGMDITDTMNETEKDLLTRYKSHLTEMQRIQGEIDNQQAVIDSDSASAEEKIIAENRKKILNLFTDYPYKLMPEQKAFFDKGNPFQVSFSPAEATKTG